MHVHSVQTALSGTCNQSRSSSVTLFWPSQPSHSTAVIHISDTGHPWPHSRSDCRRSTLSKTFSPACNSAHPSGLDFKQGPCPQSGATVVSLAVALHTDTYPDCGSDSSPRKPQPISSNTQGLDPTVPATVSIHAHLHAVNQHDCFLWMSVGGRSATPVSDAHRLRGALPDCKAGGFISTAPHHSPTQSSHCSTAFMPTIAHWCTAAINSFNIDLDNQSSLPRSHSEQPLALLV